MQILPSFVLQEEDIPYENRHDFRIRHKKWSASLFFYEPFGKRIVYPDV